MNMTYTYLMIVLGLFPLTMILVAAFYVLNNKSLKGKTSTIILRTLGIVCFFVSALVLATFSELALYNQGAMY